MLQADVLTTMQVAPPIPQVKSSTNLLLLRDTGRVHLKAISASNNSTRSGLIINNSPDEGLGRFHRANKATMTKVSKHLST